MYIIGIAGGSGSGKTTLVDGILNRIPREEIAILPQDAYYKDNSNIPLEDRFKLNYDHPDSIEWELMRKDINLLKSGQTINCPTYSYLTCTRLEETIPISPKKNITSRRYTNIYFTNHLRSVRYENIFRSTCRSTFDTYYTKRYGL